VSIRMQLTPLRSTGSALSISSVVCLAVIGICSPRPAFGLPNDAHPAKAEEAIVGAFDNYRVVALGDAHGLQQEHTFIQALLRNPKFSSKVTDIVVECANASYQDVIDRYVAGQNVPISEVRQAWRNTTQSPYGPWDALVYEQLFVAARAANKKLPANRRLRIVAGDPPIDWSTIQRGADVEVFLNQRDAYFAAVVEKLLARNRKVLLIVGVGHVLKAQPRLAPPALKNMDTQNGRQGQPQRMRPLLKKPTAAGPDALPHLVPPNRMSGNVTVLLQEHFPGSILVVVPHTGFGTSAPMAAGSNATLEGRMDAWPKPSLVFIKDTWLGAVKASDIYPGGIGPDGQRQNPFSGLSAIDLADAYLYLGPRESLTWSQPSPESMREVGYVMELNRRAKIMFGQPFAPQRLGGVRKK
jgi:hypothetical protein